MIRILILVLLITAYFVADAHPMHVSVTEIEYDEKEKELEITMRVFVEDLEKSIQTENNNPDLDLMKPAASTTKALVDAYLKKNVSIVLDGKLQTAKFLGQELDGDALICYIQVPVGKKWKTIDVRNSCLMNIYNDQSNLVHVRVRDDIKSMRLTPDNPSGKLSFDY